MPTKVRFIGRKNEIGEVKRLAQSVGSCCVLGFAGPGGVGKTRFLDQLHSELQSSNTTPLIITEIIDFDASELQTDDVFSFEEKLLESLDKTSFQTYFQQADAYHNMESAGSDIQNLQKKLEQVHQTFIANYNESAKLHRTVILVDTFEKTSSLPILAKYFKQFCGNIQNTLIVLAGRHEDGRMAAFFEGLKEYPGLQANLMHLQPLPYLDQMAYLAAKLEQIDISLPLGLKNKILALSRGFPILIDLAVEWISRDIPLPGIASLNIEEIESLAADKKEALYHEFECQLVKRISQIREPLDKIFLLLSWIYPLDARWIEEILGLPEKLAEERYEESKSYVFVKVLPDGRITLHDEMRRMVEEYVWPEVDSTLQREYSKRAIKYIDQQIEKIETSLRQRMDTKKLATRSDNEVLVRELWQLKIQKMQHLLVVDINDAVPAFNTYFDSAMNTSRYLYAEALLQKVDAQIGQLSAEHVIEFNLRKARYLMLLDKGKREEARKMLIDTLNDSNNLAVEQRFELLFQLGHIEVRLANVRNAIEKFSECVILSEQHQMRNWLLRSKNALGWAYRTMGDRETATRLYREAKELCLDADETENIYGQVLINLAFVLSYHDHQSAIGLGKLAVDHWGALNNNSLGLARATCSLGCIYYQARLYDHSLQRLNEALKMFEQLQHNEWMGVVYSWRGAVYQDLGEYEKAESDLRKSLDLVADQNKAMTLNRLSRVFMSRKDWKTAEEYLRQSYIIAQEIPDYVYWLGSLARLITIAAERKEYARLQEFQRLVSEFETICEFPDLNSLGIANFALARLAIGQGSVDVANKYLEDAITDVVEYGSYAHTDIGMRLSYVEKDFENLDVEVVRKIGKRLRDIFRQKEGANASYDVVSIRLYRWEKWENQEKQIGV